MKTVWIGNNVNLKLKNSLRNWLHHLLVDVLPTLLLLVVLAYSMAFVAQLLAKPHDVDLKVISELLF